MKICRRALVALFIVCIYLVFFQFKSFAAAPVDLIPFGQADTLEDIRAIIKHNGYNFTVGHNWVFDMPAEEKERFFSRRPPVTTGKTLAKEDPGLLSRYLGMELPSSFDWRNYNGHSYIGAIRDQGNCGSCYAFAACAAAEGTYNRANGRYDGRCVDFSEAFIIWCLGRLPEYNIHFFGCYGADYDYYELEALTAEGVCSESDFPYTIYNPGSCTHWGDPVKVFESWYRVDCNDIDGIKTAIMTYGVVDAAVQVVSAFQGYDSGIYKDTNIDCPGKLPDFPECYYTPTNHAVALVGWDDNGGDKDDGYWILRNSWGTSWGEEGYMRIKYTSARVACEVCYLVISREPKAMPWLKLLLFGD
ncbi:MAG TPA: C1 family peptidase [Desulfobacteraceae bacterium]|nr:C1 family peptidase [Desulfobacteraceae bacterium]HPJ69112.1 C1 family peptidase [Desulfobacteraceae bacterium]HPQ27716.1 C1 family peptidase [Desulfobacteraceae bacterium]